MKQIITISIFLLLPIIILAQNKLDIGISSGIGFDFQTRSNNFNLTGPLIIPAGNESSILHIEKPYNINVELTYKKNKNLGFILNLGTTNRALRYWSLDERIEPYTFRNDKINLSIRTYNIETGVKFSAEISEKIYFYWNQTFGVSFGLSSPRTGLTKEHSQAELIFLKDQQIGVLVNVNQQNPIISINSAFGVGYKIAKRVYLNFGLRYINEVSNGNDLILWGYDLDQDQVSGGYSPYDLEFKTLFSTIGITYSIGKL